MMDFALSADWGLSEAIRFYNNCARHAAALDRVHFVKYEEMRRNSGEILHGILQFAEAPFTRDEALEAADFTSFDKLRNAEMKNTFNSSALRPGDVRDPDSFKVRRAKVHGYRDYFSAAEAERLENILAEKLDSSLGYSQRLQCQGEKNYELS
jgi:Sulfotransferase domain